ncbi:MAG: DUF177 domain-containing protein [Clostridiales bacterium]|nr:DUF177 domain-containing protein [Clostridiales bacterium]
MYNIKSMDIDLSNVPEGQICDFRYTPDVGGLAGERLVVFTAPALVEGSYIKIGGGLTVKARLFVSAVFNCDRCLTEVERKLSIPVNGVFHKAEAFGGGVFNIAAAEHSGEGYLYEGTTVCLDEIVKEKFVLSFPEYVVCKPGCKGLCPVCGCDLNVNQCNCQENQKDDGSGNPFAALKDISSGGKNGGTKKKNF